MLAHGDSLDFGLFRAKGDQFKDNRLIHLFGDNFVNIDIEVLD